MYRSFFSEENCANFLHNSSVILNSVMATNSVPFQKSRVVGGAEQAVAARSTFYSVAKWGNFFGVMLLRSDR